MGRKGYEFTEGRRFGRFVVIREVEPARYPCGASRRRILCKCSSCGNVKIIVADRLLHAKEPAPNSSCHCHVKVGTYSVEERPIAKNLRHVYHDMKYRCYNPRHSWYKRYGGRGITICNEWLNNFPAFYKWSIQNGYRQGLSIDRIDNNGNYCPENCRWATCSMQSSNTSRNIKISDKRGTVKNLKEWSKILNIPYATLYYRYKRMKHDYIEDLIVMR